MMPTSPCKGCEERHPHCHSACERYQTYRSELEKSKAERHAKIDENAFMYDIKKPIVKRYDRRRRGDDK